MKGIELREASDDEEDFENELEVNQSKLKSCSTFRTVVLIFKVTCSEKNIPYAF